MLDGGVSEVRSADDRKMGVKKLEHGKRVLRRVLAILLFLSLGKLFAGIISNTPLLIADATHSFIDLSAAITAYIGLSIASLPASRKFPYGYYKAESLAALFVSLFILFAAFELVADAFERLFLAPHILYPQLALSVAIISGIASFVLFKYQKKGAEVVGSCAMKASAEDMLLDFFSSMLVFLALALAYFNIPYVESLATVVIAFIVAKIALENLYDALLALMDVAPREIERKVLKVIGSFSGIEGFSNLRLRKAGPFAFGEITIKVRKHLSVKEAHEISDMLEARIKEKVPEIEGISVHIEPYEETKQIVAVPVTRNKGLNSEISRRFARARGFVIALVDLRGKRVEFLEYAKNPHAREKVIAGLATAKWLTRNYRINAVLAKEMGEIAYNALRQSLVDVYLARGKYAKEALLAFARGDSRGLTPKPRA